MNEKWRDYSKYTDKQLDDLLKGFAGQADYPAVVFEYQRLFLLFPSLTLHATQEGEYTRYPFTRTRAMCQLYLLSVARGRRSGAGD